MPQVFDGKISTWRLRDHGLKKGDVVAFENSQTEEIFGFGELEEIVGNAENLANETDLIKQAKKLSKNKKGKS